MKTSKVGTYAAYLQAVVLLLVLIFQFAIEPMQGLMGPDDFVNSAKVQAYQKNAPALFFLDNFTGVLVGATILVLAMVLHQRLHEHSELWSRVAANSGVLAAGLFVLAGIIGNLSPASYSVVFPMFLAAIFVYGWWLFLTNWVALRSDLPKPLCYLGMVWGVLGILGFILFPTPLGLLVAIAPLLGVVWSVWLGMNFSKAK